MSLEFTQFKDFLKAVKKFTSNSMVEAPKIDKLTEEVTNREIKLLQGEGKKIANLILPQSKELFDILPDGTLVKVNLYIATQDINQNWYYKYHISQCKTIREMIASGRKHRYKMNNRNDGTFYYQFTKYRGQSRVEENQRLELCKYCLSQFLNKQYVNDWDVKNFNLKKFHESNRNIFSFDTSALEKGESAVANEYVEEWNKISKHVREKHKYTCQSCGFKAKNSYEKRFIHTHHQNGDKGNNTKENLMVLCIKCHSRVDMFHLRIKQTDVYREFLLLTTN